MGAHLYKKTTTEGGIISLSHLRAIRLSGAEGIVAKFVESHRDQEDLENWILSVDEICQLTGEAAEDAVLLFISPMEQDGEPMVSEVKTLSGKSSIMETELLLMMQPLQNAILTETDKQIPATISYPENQKTDSVFESLLIKGGVSTLKHSWKLGPPKMQIGGMIRNG